MDSDGILIVPIRKPYHLPTCHRHRHRHRHRHHHRINCMHLHQYTQSIWINLVFNIRTLFHLLCKIADSSKIAGLLLMIAKLVVVAVVSFLANWCCLCSSIVWNSPFEDGYVYVAGVLFHDMLLDHLNIQNSEWALKLAYKIHHIPQTNMNNAWKKNLKHAKHNAGKKVIVDHTSFFRDCIHGIPCVISCFIQMATSSFQSVFFFACKLNWCLQMYFIPRRSCCCHQRTVNGWTKM